jgi:hypothetical protein
MDDTTESTAEAVTEDTTDAAPPDTTDADTAEVGDTFSRPYVEKLRDDVAKYRVRAQRTTELEQRLHTELVRATGHLADPADLEFNAEHLDSAESLTAAISSLLEAKPHLRSRTPKGDAGQGYRQSEPEPASWLSILKTV